MREGKGAATATEDLRGSLVNAVTGHMPGSGECSEYLIRGAVRWAYEQVVAPLEAERDRYRTALGAMAAASPQSFDWYQRKAREALSPSNTNTREGQA